jgi:hypothetical protein
MGSLFDRLQGEIEDREQPGGLSPIDLLDMPPALAAVVKQIVRRNGMKLTEISESLGESLENTRQTLNELIQKGYVRQVEVKGDSWYKAHFAQKRNRTVSQTLWTALDGIVEQDNP